MSRRDEIIDVALRLFAEQGYQATTITQIEAAAGLSPGAGGLYRHIGSKRELLVAAFDRVIDSRRAAQQAPGIAEPADPRTAISIAGRAFLGYVAADRDLYRLVLRGGADLPVDLTDLYQRLFQPGFDEVAGWLTQLAAGRRDFDAAAVAAVALSSLCYFAISEFTYGCPPGDIAQERFLAAWTDGLLAQLGARP
ncbi:TetR/AcrR family transcriptional regulator [Micromonospora zingiberis]|uniref:TetR/AcrR family transcriptional regulator n=1 Tax=Micromonospora zingiberis TaxID=2053011 RepID=A0A4R0GHB5_9ACTN|nr:TetR/AcrR family transcriptional regulator [Micromonospora zingiberis]TCB96740.1 TetR/AcrR family transcriptional regulator [Micromonospora zingiberis]